MKQFATLFSMSLIVLLFLTGCGGAIETLHFDSPAGDRSIDVSGERESPMGPIIVTVKLTVPKGSESFTFEHQASKLTKETVKADWKGPVQCNLTFMLDDDTSWEVEAYLFDDELKAIKNYSLDGKKIF